MPNETFLKSEWRNNSRLFLLIKIVAEAAGKTSSSTHLKRGDSNSSVIRAALQGVADIFSFDQTWSIPVFLNLFKHVAHLQQNRGTWPCYILFFHISDVSIIG